MSSQNFPSFLLRYVCGQKQGLSIVFGFLLVEIVVLITSLSVTKPGSPTYVLAVVNLIGLGLIETIILVLFVACWYVTGNDPMV